MIKRIPKFCPLCKKELIPTEHCFNIDFTSCESCHNFIFHVTDCYIRIDKEHFDYVWKAIPNYKQDKFKEEIRVRRHWEDKILYKESVVMTGMAQFLKRINELEKAMLFL